MVHNGPKIKYLNKNILGIKEISKTTGRKSGWFLFYLIVLFFM